MLKGILSFALTRRAIVLLGLLVFICGGLFAYAKLNIEAYPNPAPVILEITAQAPGLSAEEMERYYTIPMEVGSIRRPASTTSAPPRSTACLRARHLQVRRRLLLRLHAGRAACSRTSIPAGQSGAADPAIEPGRRNLSLSGGGPAAFRADQPAHGAGLDRAAPAARPFRAWCRSTAGAARPRSSRSRSTCNKLEAYNVTLPQLITALGNANVNVGGREIAIGQQSVNIRGVGLIDDGGTTT
jgi:cobalt-zinc-cadmium resistance protein CzcA